MPPTQLSVGSPAVVLSHSGIFSDIPLTRHYSKVHSFPHHPFLGSPLAFTVPSMMGPEPQAAFPLLKKSPGPRCRPLPKKHSLLTPKSSFAKTPTTCHHKQCSGTTTMTTRTTPVSSSSRKGLRSTMLLEAKHRGTGCQHAKNLQSPK
jgi:hypothetical protein